MPDFATRVSTRNVAALPELDYAHRHSAIRFVSPDGDCGEEAHAINFTELYNLKGRLLTLVDATFPDAEQRKAQKDLVWQTLRAWMADTVVAEDVAEYESRGRAGQAAAT